MIEEFQRVLGIVSPSFLIIALGFAYNKLHKLDTETVVQWTMHLLVPAFAFHHILKMQVDLSQAGSVFMSAWILLLASGVLAFFVFRYLSISHRGLYLPIMFVNTVNLPFPILLSAYGEGVLPYCLMFYLATLLGIFTVGLMIVSGQNNPWIQIFKEPVIYVMGAAFFIKFNGISVPGVVTIPVKLLADATVPLILLSLGVQLSDVKPVQLRLSFLATGCRFLGGLAIGWLCVNAFDLTGLARKVVLFNCIMPSAVINYLVAQKYQADGDLVASTILITTLLSLILIPLSLILL